MRDHKRATGAVALAALARAAAAFTKTRSQAHTGVFENGKRGGEEADEQRDRQREQQYGSIDRDLVGAGQTRGRESDKCRQSDVGERRSQHATDEAENEAFDKEICSADQKKIGDVGAGDEENEANASHQHP